jgi:hypothetical protein
LPHVRAAVSAALAAAAPAARRWDALASAQSPTHAQQLERAAAAAVVAAAAGGGQNDDEDYNGDVDDGSGCGAGSRVAASPQEEEALQRLVFEAIDAMTRAEVRKHSLCILLQQADLDTYVASPLTPTISFFSFFGPDNVRARVQPAAAAARVRSACRQVTAAALTARRRSRRRRRQWFSWGEQ